MKHVIANIITNPIIPVKIQIPECSCHYGCCADCQYMDTNDKNKYGDSYCGYFRKYFPASDRACGHFME